MDSKNNNIYLFIYLFSTYLHKKLELDTNLPREDMHKDISLLQMRISSKCHRKNK